jgi:hypothetical protein
MGTIEGYEQTEKDRSNREIGNNRRAGTNGKGWMK